MREVDSVEEVSVDRACHETLDEDQPKAESEGGTSKGGIPGIPLVVDLDGTLVSTDTLFESALSLIRKSPLSILQFPVWLIRGKARLKSEVCRRCLPKVENLPYRADLLNYLQQQRNDGRKLVLATAAHESAARSTSAYLGLFDEVLASTDSVNLKGAEKRNALVRRFGFRGFDYVGNSTVDAPVWESCRVGHVVGHLQRLPGSAVSAGTRQGKIFPTPRPSLKTWLREMRAYQWVKNLLVVVPTLLNHRLDGEVLKALAITFLGFSLVGSGSYIANDLFDLDADRRHPRKSKRPLATGEISIVQGLLMALFLPLAGLLLGLLVSKQLLFCLLLYLALTTLYSSFLKGKPILDVIVLAVLYTLRVYVGGVVTSANISPWLFQFSMFLFLSLAFVKRYSELQRLRNQGELEAVGRGYRPPDLDIISQAGLGSGLLASLVLALYVNAQEIERLYPRPQMLWGVCPLFVYWIIRVWLVAHRGNMREDPILFAFRDHVSYIVGILIIAAVLFAMLPHSPFPL